MQWPMTSTPMAGPVTALVGACLLGAAASCAGSAPKVNAPPPPVASAAGTPVASAAPVDSAAATPVAPAAAPPVATAATPATSAAATAAAPVAPAVAPAAAPAAPVDSAALAAPPAASGAPAAPPAAPAAVAAPTAAPEPPASSAAVAPTTTAPEAAAPAAAPAPLAPRILIADELPYVPGHLRARDGKPEHRRAHEAGHETAGREPGKRPYHPAPGIVVDVVAAEGGSTAPDLQRVARNLGYWPFRQCYEDGLRRDPHISGKVSLELVVSPSGAVDRSSVTSATMRDEMVAACVAREARRLALPASASPTTAKVDVSLALGDEPVPSGHPVPNAEKLRDALRGSWGAVRRCYASAVASRPHVGGRMELRFHLRHGEIVEVAEQSAGSEGGPRFGDGDVTRCVLAVYRGVHLPASAHATHEKSFVYALQLESTPSATP
jgi:hypothetical protein